MNKKIKKIKISEQTYQALKSIREKMDTISYSCDIDNFNQKDFKPALYGVFSDKELLAHVPSDIATKTVDFQGEPIGVLTIRELNTVCLTKKSCEEYIAFNNLENPEIQLLDVSTGHTFIEISRLAQALFEIFDLNK